MVVSVVHLFKGNWKGQRYLDGNEAATVTAFLFHDGDHDDPERLIANAEKSFVGSYVLGMGFTFDDLRNQEVATPTAIMDELIAKDPSNREVIFPYIGGDELNTSPSHAHDRFVINFGDRDAEVCRGTMA